MLTLDEVPDDPQVQARKMIVGLDTPEGGKVKQVGISVEAVGYARNDSVARAEAGAAYR